MANSFGISRYLPYSHYLYVLGVPLAVIAMRDQCAFSGLPQSVDLAVSVVRFVDETAKQQEVSPLTPCPTGAFPQVLTSSRYTK